MGEKSIARKSIEDHVKNCEIGVEGTAKLLFHCDDALPEVLFTLGTTSLGMEGTVFNEGLLIQEDERPLLKEFLSSLLARRKGKLVKLQNRAPDLIRIAETIDSQINLAEKD